MRPECRSDWARYESVTPVAIPDARPAGVKSTIEVRDPGSILALAVDVDITHPYRGDLSVYLLHADGTRATLVETRGGSADNLVETFAVDGFAGKPAAGSYTLLVVDGARQDRGTLNRWTLRIARSE